MDILKSGSSRLRDSTSDTRRATVTHEIKTSSGKTLKTKQKLPDEDCGTLTDPRLVPCFITGYMVAYHEQ